MANGFAYGMSLYEVRYSNGETVTLLARNLEQARSLSIYTHPDLEITSVAEQHVDTDMG
jgi:uncharacterized protein YgiM (DUF1202 family)